MWIRTVNGWSFIEVEQTQQGLWIPKKCLDKNKCYCVNKTYSRRS